MLLALPSDLARPSFEGLNVAKLDGDEGFWDRLARKYAADPIADLARL
jgi:hypothetical protein